jgi:hypothetical protein
MMIAHMIIAQPSFLKQMVVLYKLHFLAGEPLPNDLGEKAKTEKKLGPTHPPGQLKHAVPVVTAREKTDGHSKKQIWSTTEKSQPNPTLISNTTPTLISTQTQTVISTKTQTQIQTQTQTQTQTPLKLKTLES